jgi:signal transduction histidine kinase
VTVYSVKDQASPVKWVTNWNESTLDDWDNAEDMPIGTRIEVSQLRIKWTERKIANLIDYLSITYDDDKMCIEVNPNNDKHVHRYFCEPILGKHCVSKIILKYDSSKQKLDYTINSDEFTQEAQIYCPDLDLYEKNDSVNVFDELLNDKEIDLTKEELLDALTKLGDFSTEFFFSLKSSTTKEKENFLYKYDSLINRYEEGVVLYRNAFSISSFEGKRDWLEFGKRSRKSPAAATHPSGAWRVRENQISGKVMIDKKDNEDLRDLSNRQGLEENIYYHLFTKIIVAGIAGFERYRQSLIRAIDKKNKQPKESKTAVINRILRDPNEAKNLSTSDTQTLIQEIAIIKEESKTYKEEKQSTEERYRYDVRILNVLATSGLKATSIAHELKNDRNSASVNYDYIVSALKKYDLWDDLNSPESTEHSYKNVPQLLKRNKDISEKILVFMDTMLDEVEKRKFTSKRLNIQSILKVIKSNWERDYGCLKIVLDIDDELYYDTSEDIFTVIFDNLILNSLQQNENQSNINITISVRERGNHLDVFYCDDGIGLPQKYINDPMRILAVHETSRKNGHGLGMWIVNNTVLMTGGLINNIDGHAGFSIKLEVGDKS